MLFFYSPAEVWSLIPGHWKRAFLIVLGINFFVFFYGMAQFPLGDHDVGYLSGVPYLSGGAAGRWFSPFIYSLSGFVQIPVYTQTLAFIFQIAAGMGAVLLWNREASLKHLVAGGLLVSLIPFVNEHYFYHWQAAVFPFAQLCMVLALAVSQKYGYWRVLFATALVTMGLASYQAAVTTFGVVWCGLLAIAVARWEGTPGAIRPLVRKFLFLLVPLALGGLVYAGSITFFAQFGLIKLDDYQFQAASSPLLFRVWDVVQHAFIHLWLSQPYSPRILKILLLGVVLTGGASFVMAGYRTATRNALLRAGGLVCLLAALVVASKSLFLFSGYSSGVYAYRINSCGLSYVYLFFLSALFVSSAHLWRRVGMVCLCLLIPVCIINDLRAQIHLVQSNLHDFSVLNRVMNRVEALDAFDPEKEYALVQFGRTKPYIPSVYKANEYDTDEGVYFFDKTVSQTWRPGFELRLVSRYLNVSLQLDESNTEHRDIIARAASMAKGRKPFPHKDACFILDGNILVFVFEEQAVQRALNRQDLNFQ